MFAVAATSFLRMEVHFIGFSTSIFVTCHLMANFLNKIASNMARAADGVMTS